MVAASANQFPKVILEEVATDGSATTTPAADHRALFLGEDGGLHLKDSAAAVTDVGGGTPDAHAASHENGGSDEIDVTGLTGAGGGGIDEGTSFPGGPSTGDLFHRTDLTPPLWRYDGTRWRCTCIHEHHLGHTSNSTATIDIYTPVMPQGYDMWLIDLITAMEAASGLSGSAYWRADLYSKNAGTLSGVLATTNIQSGTNANMIRGSAAIGALLGTTADGFVLEFAKVSTPGGLWSGGIVTYQLVGP